MNPNYSNPNFIPHKNRSRFPPPPNTNGYMFQNRPPNNYMLNQQQQQQQFDPNMMQYANGNGSMIRPPPHFGAVRGPGHYDQQVYASNNMYMSPLNQYPPNMTPQGPPLLPQVHLTQPGGIPMPIAASNPKLFDEGSIPLVQSLPPHMNSSFPMSQSLINAPIPNSSGIMSEAEFYKYQERLRKEKE